MTNAPIFEILIDYDEKLDKPQRVFDALSKLIEGFEKLDSAFLKTLDPDIKSRFVLQEVKSGSVKAYFKTILEGIDDKTLKSGTWAGIAGATLCSVKNVTIDHMNKGIKTKRSLSNLAENLRQEAELSKAGSKLVYNAIPLEDLGEIILDISEAKSQLAESDKIYISSNNTRKKLNFKNPFTEKDLERIFNGKLKKQPTVKTTLIVKKPDYLGNTRWECKFGTKNLLVRIDDKKWLSDFQSRKFDLRPGDALSCEIVLEYYYDHNNKLTNEAASVKKILDVLPNEVFKQGRLNLKGK